MSAWEAQLLPRSKTGREPPAATRVRTEDACAGPSAACTRAPVARTAHACTHPPGTAEHGHPAERTAHARTTGKGRRAGPQHDRRRDAPGRGRPVPRQPARRNPDRAGEERDSRGDPSAGPGAASAFPGSERAFSVTWKQRLDLKTTQGRPRVPARTCKHAWPHRPPGRQPREMRLQGLVPGGAHTPHWPPA